jgi:Ran-binding protein 9/10
VSQGKSSFAAIERVVQQTEVMMRFLGDDGGPGAFVNLKNDYLRGEDC